MEYDYRSAHSSVAIRHVNPGIIDGPSLKCKERRKIQTQPLDVTLAQQMINQFVEEITRFKSHAKSESRT
jgi:hypothetical protein